MARGKKGTWQEQVARNPKREDGKWCYVTPKGKTYGGQINRKDFRATTPQRPTPKEAAKDVEK